MFRITGGRGFHMVFDNGYTVSVQFGPMNYCAMRDVSMDTTNGFWDCTDAEVMIWHRGGDTVTARAWREVHNEELHDTVVGHLSPDEVMKLMQWAHKQPSLVAGE